MAVYYVIYNEVSEGNRLPIGTKWEGVTTLDAQKTARVCELEASSVAEAQKFVMARIGSSASLPVVVAEAAYKTS